MLLDAQCRPMKEFRISVTDRCNFRCFYCMPHDDYEWVARAGILTLEEIIRTARLFMALGVQKIRLTGGEPLLRRNLAHLVASLSSLPGLRDLCLTTNGYLLESRISSLAESGLKRVNVSIDSLDPEVFHRLTGRNDVYQVVRGLFAAKRAGINPVKINAVVVRGINDQGILDLVEFSRSHGFPIRFVEYMDAGNSSNWGTDKLVSKQEILEKVSSRHPLRKIGRTHESEPSVGYQFADGCGDIGVIASVTEPFCSACTRVRLTADGKLVTCLFSEQGHDLKSLLRSGASDEEILQLIRSVWGSRNDRFSEERHAALNSEQGYRSRERTKIEMIKLGG